MNIFAASIKRPSWVIVLFTVLTLAGLASSLFLRFELLPQFSPPNITVVTVYPGAAPGEVEEGVTKIIEDLISGVAGITSLKATSYENYSLVQVELKQDMDVDEAVNTIQKRITAGLASLPDGVQPPAVRKFDFNDLPIIKLGVYSDLPPTAFYDLLKDNIQPAISRVDGVGEVQILGGREREIQVNLLRKKLEAYHVSIGQVLEAVARANVEIPAGRIRSEEGQMLVRLSGKFTNLEQLRELTISTMPDGTAIQLGDIAEVLDASKDIHILARANGRDALGLYILKQSDANAVEVSRRVKAVISRLEDDYKDQGLSFEVLQDTSQFTLEAANGVFQDLMLAIILVAMVMFVFLQSLRNSLIIMFVVPLSLVATLGVMYVLGYTYNLLSLLGLTLAVGTLVDDAIVVIENIYRHLEMGKNRLQAAYDGVKELGLTLVATTTTLVVVFIPITLAGGLVSDLLTQFAITVSVSVIFSTVAAFTMVPYLASRFARIEDFSNNPVLHFLVGIFEKGVNFLAVFVRNLLKMALANKWLTLLIALGLLAFSVSLIPMRYIGVDFLEAGDRGEFLIRLKLSRDAPLEQSNRLARQAEMLVKDRPEVVSVFTTVGITYDTRLAQGTENLAELNVRLVDKSLRDLSTPIIARQVKNKLERSVIGAKINVVSINLIGLADAAPVDVKILGTQLDTIREFSKVVKEEVDKIPGIVELKTSIEEGTPELKLRIDRQKMEDLGLTTGQVALILRTALTGNTSNKFRDNQNEYDINIRLDAFDRRKREDLMQLSFLNKQGQRIYLYQFAEITESEGPAALERTSRTPSISIRAQIVGRPFGDVNQDIVERVSALRQPPDTEVQFQGSQKQQTEGFTSLIYAGIASILLLYFTLVVLYDSFAYPFVVLFTIPLAVIGAFLALGMSMEVISLFSITGMMMLVGLVAKNAILVVDFTVVLREQGLDLRDALMTATRLRFRPVLMTNISMIIGLIPVAIATGPGAEWKNGLGWALIGGLTSSMFLSLIVVPVVYYLMERFLGIFGWDERREVEIEM